MTDPTPITYADLRDDDILIDKSGGRWHVSGVAEYLSPADITFWLGDARTKVRVHHMTKPAGDPCTVDRVETLADTVEKLEAGWPKPSLPGVASPEEDARRAAVLKQTFTPDPSRTPGDGGPPTESGSTEKPTKLEATSTGGPSTTPDGAGDPWRTAELEAAAHDAAVAAVEQGMPGAKVDTDSTAAEVDAAAKATDDDPVVLPLFETMTLLEQRSHLFVLHGVFAEDLDDSKTLSETHFAATRDRAMLKLRSVYKPHEHSASVTA